MCGVLEDALQNTHGENREEQRGDEVTGSNNLETPGGQFVPQLVGGIPAPVLQGLVVLAPKESVSRYGHYHQTIFTADPLEFAQCREIIVRVLKDVHCGDDVELIIVERQALCCRKNHRIDAPALAELQ